MTIRAGVRDKANILIGWFENTKEADDFIRRHDPEGTKGFHRIKAI